MLGRRSLLGAAGALACSKAIGQSCGGVPIPAAAAGYTTQTYGPLLTLGSNPTVSPLTGNIQPFNFFGTSWQSIGVTQNGDGSIAITGQPPPAFGNQLCSAAFNTIDGAPYMLGHAFGGGGYFVATLSMATTPPSNLGASFWANDIESMGGGSDSDTTLRQWTGQAAGYGNWIEIDAPEFDVGNTTQMGHGMHNFYGIPNVTCGAGVTCDVNTGSYPGFISPVTVPSGTNFTQLHRYGYLWIPATATTQGSMTWYFDDVQIGNSVVWNQYNPTANPPPPVEASSAFAVLDGRHIAMIVGNGDASNLVTLHAISVWQKSAANNISR